jgi:hypothetical protein
VSLIDKNFRRIGNRQVVATQRDMILRNAPSCYPSKLVATTVDKSTSTIPMIEVDYGTRESHDPEGVLFFFKF